MPKISIILPVYNGAHFLAESLESVLKQSFSDFELFIINDGSTDYSEQIIQQYAKNDARIKYFKNEKNLGVQQTLNKGLAFAQGEFIARIDSDDIWCDQDKLKKQLDFLESNPEYAIIGTNMIIFDENGNELQRVSFKRTDDEIRNSMLFSSPFAHPSIMLRAKALDEVGFYATERKYLHIEDYELWLRIGTKYKMANLPDYCLKYRVHGNNISGSMKFSQKIQWILLTKKYSRAYPHGTKAMLVKFSSLFINKKFLNLLIQKNRFVAALYAKLSGIEKSSH